MLPCGGNHPGKWHSVPQAQHNWVPWDAGKTTAEAEPSVTAGQSGSEVWLFHLLMVWVRQVYVPQFSHLQDREMIRTHPKMRQCKAFSIVLGHMYAFQWMLVIINTFTYSQSLVWILSWNPQWWMSWHQCTHRPEKTTSYRSLILPTDPPPTSPCSTGSYNPLPSPLLRTLLTVGLSSQTVFEGKSWRVLILNELDTWVLSSTQSLIFTVCQLFFLSSGSCSPSVPWRHVNL